MSVQVVTNERRKESATDIGRTRWLMTAAVMMPIDISVTRATATKNVFAGSSALDDPDDRRRVTRKDKSI